jgi:hypothetical protein
MDDGCAAASVHGALGVESVAAHDLGSRRGELAGPLRIARDRSRGLALCSQAAYDGRTEPSCRAEDDVQLLADETLAFLRAARAVGTSASNRDREDPGAAPPSPASSRSSGRVD